MEYEGVIFSPHGIDVDTVVQCTIGCSYRKCTFCDMYYGKTYRQREIKEIFRDIDLIAAEKGVENVPVVFLGDGDALNLPTQTLCAVLDKLYEKFPNLFYVGVYGSCQNIMAKTDAELKELLCHGLCEIHLGVESGDEEILRRIHKGVTPKQLIEAGQRVKKAGFSLCATIIIGIAAYSDRGSLAAQSRRHVEKTAALINDMAPNCLSLLSLILLKRTELFRQLEKGEFIQVSDEMLLDELRAMLARFDCKMSVTTLHHSNALVVDGIFPRDKEKVLKICDEAISGLRKDLLRPRKTDTV